MNKVRVKGHEFRFDPPWSEGLVCARCGYQTTYRESRVTVPAIPECSR